MNYKLFLIILFTFTLSSCEKDDICAEGTPVTPRVIVEFYKFVTPTVLENVTNLGIIEPAALVGIAFNEVSKIEVPLKTTTDITTLHFIQNGSDTVTTNDNIDVITFNYQRVDKYVSRACGFKTLFYLNVNQSGGFNC
jgi:hypothetical protein